jgi:hypothetical protein
LTILTLNQLTTTTRKRITTDLTKERINLRKNIQLLAAEKFWNHSRRCFQLNLNKDAGGNSFLQENIKKKVIFYRRKNVSRSFPELNGNHKLNHTEVNDE